MERSQFVRKAKDSYDGLEPRTRHRIHTSEGRFSRTQRARVRFKIIPSRTPAPRNLCPLKREGHIRTLPSYSASVVQLYYLQ